MKTTLCLSDTELTQIIEAVMSANSRNVTSVKFCDANGQEVALAEVQCECDSDAIKVRSAPEESLTDQRLKQLREFRDNSLAAYQRSQSNAEQDAEDIATVADAEAAEAHAEAEEVQT